MHLTFSLRHIAPNISPAQQALPNRAVPPPFCRRQTYGLTGGLSSAETVED